LDDLWFQPVDFSYPREHSSCLFKLFGCNQEPWRLWHDVQESKSEDHKGEVGNLEKLPVVSDFPEEYADKQVSERFKDELGGTNKNVMGLWLHFHVVSVANIVSGADAHAKDEDQNKSNVLVCNHYYPKHKE